MITHRASPGFPNLPFLRASAFVLRVPPVTAVTRNVTAQRGIRLGLQRRVGLLGVPKGAADADDEQKAGLSGPRLRGSRKSAAWRWDDP